MPRQLRDGIYWIQECGPDRAPEHDVAVHVPQHAYLLCGEESLLFDTLSPGSTDHVLARVEEILDGDDLDYVVPSHPDVPHAGNTRALLSAYPDAELLAPRYGDGHELYHLAEATHVGEGDSIDLGGLEVAFHEAPFPDAAIHMWMTERRTGTLFTVDWLGFAHFEGECDRFVEEFDEDVTVDRLVALHEYVLFWLEYVDPDRTTAAIDELIERYDPDVVAPAHGNPIRENPTTYMERMKAVVERISAAGQSSEDAAEDTVDGEGTADTDETTAESDGEVA